MKNLSLALILIFGISLSFNAAGQGEVRGSERVVERGGNKDEAKHSLNIEIGAHALVGLSSTNLITLKPVAPTKAGEGLDFSDASDESIYLQYSSIKATKENKITVSMTNHLPDGVSVLLEAGSAQGGKGQLGSSNNSKLTLTDSDQDLISGIGSCYTGTGSTDGHKLKYTLIMSDDASYEDLTSKTYANDVTYTITED